MKKLIFALTILLTPTICFAGVKDKALGPFVATAKYVNKIAVGTNQTLTGAIGGLNQAASGFFKDTNDFGKDIFAAITGQKVD